MRLNAGVLATDREGLARAPNGYPYTGLAYHVDDDGVLRSISIMTQGRASGLSTDWLPLTEGGLRVDSSMLDAGHGYGPFLLHGAPFSGVAYTFDEGGACTSEVLYAEGFPTETLEREWYACGSPLRVLDHEGCTVWFEDGRIRQRAIAGELRYNVVVRENGRLVGIYMVDPQLFDIDTVRRLPFDRELMLMGDGFDTHLLATLRLQASLSSVQMLNLVRTSVGPDAVELLAGLPSLNTLRLEHTPAIGQREVARLQALRPELAILVKELPARRVV